MTTADTPLPLPPSSASPTEHLFPVLTEAQIARIAAHGRRRAIAAGDVLVGVGDRTVPFFAVVSGELRVSRPSGTAETLIVIHRRGQFSGEGTMISGRRALARIRATEPGEVIELDREQVMSLS